MHPVLHIPLSLTKHPAHQTEPDFQPEDSGVLGIRPPQVVHLPLVIQSGLECHQVPGIPEHQQLLPPPLSDNHPPLSYAPGQLPVCKVTRFPA